MHFESADSLIVTRAHVQAIKFLLHYIELLNNNVGTYLLYNR